MNIQVPCIRSNKNTGELDCPFDIGILYWAILAPKGSDTITASNRATQATLKTFLEGKFQHANPALRWHKFGPIIDTQDTSEAASVQTLPDGSKITVDDMHQAMDIFFRKGGIQMNNNRRSFNKLSEYYTIYFLDKNKRLIGTTDPENADNAIGADMDDLYTPAPKGATRTTIPEYKTSITMTDVNQLNDNVFAMQLTFDAGKIPGVRDIYFKNVDSRYTLTAGQHAFEVLTDGGSINLVETLGAAMATATNYIMKDAAGDAVTKTAALAPDSKAIIASASLVDTDYVNGQPITIEWDLAQGGTNGAKWFETDANNKYTVTANNP